MIGTDSNAAWLLVVRDNQIGWMPSFYSQTNIGTFTSALVIAPLPDRCTGYLGAIQKAEEEWIANTDGSVVIYGAIYRPRASTAFEDASLIAQVNGKGGKIAGGDYLHTKLTESSSVVLFAFSFEDVQRGSTVKLRLDNPGSEPLSFEAVFFSNDCRDELRTTGAPFTNRLPVGVARIPPLPTPLPVASVPPGSAATATPIVVRSGPKEEFKPVSTPLPSPTAVAPRFTAERLTINSGECTTLRWNADGAETVYLNGVSVPQSGTRRVCPSETFAYVLTIRESDGRRNDWWLNVEVQQTLATPAPPNDIAPSAPEPAAVSTTEVVTDRRLLDEYLLAILRFQQVRKALLETPNLPMPDDLAAVASGEALEQVRVELGCKAEHSGANTRTKHGY
jgi:hypothetical protein